MEQEVGVIWEKTCHKLLKTLPKDIFERWIAVIRPRSLEADRLILSVGNDFYQSWLEDNYLPLISHAVATVAGRELKIEFTVDSSSATPISAPPTPQRHPRKAHHAGTTSANLNSDYTFENFIVGPSNSLAHAAALAVAQAPARAYNPLFVYGGTGLGKTHLMQAIGNQVLLQGRHSVYYTSCEAFTNAYIDALQKKSLVEFRKRMRSYDVLLIDDVHFLSGKEGLQEEFFHTFNALYESRKQIVLTCDRPAAEIPSIEHRLVTRFEWGMVAEIQPPDLEMRIAILRQKQTKHGLHLPDHILELIASIVRTDIRSLEGALTRVISYASLTGNPLNEETVEHVLRDKIDQARREVVTVEMIQRAVAEYFDIRLADMTGRSRSQNIALPRQIAMYLCRVLTDLSLPSIAERFARNHATVLYAINQIEERMKQDPEFRQTVSSLRQRLSRS